MAANVRFFDTSWGARVAYTVVGEGPPLVVLPPWTSHLVGEAALSGHAAFLEVLTASHAVVRFDRWGTGLSDRARTDFRLDRDREVLLELVDHLQLQQFALVGPSHGGPLAVAFAVRHPSRVSHLVLYGSRASALTSGKTWGALRELILANWPVAARSIAAVATRGGDPSDVDVFAEVLVMSATPETTVALQDAIHGDVAGVLADVRTPTLVLHRRGDELVSSDEAVELAARIPGAHLELVEGAAHVHLVGDAAELARRICLFVDGHGAARAQLSPREPESRGDVPSLSGRELEVADLVAAGLTSRQIAERLFISERTAQNHVQHILAKLGFSARSQIAAWAARRTQ